MSKQNIEESVESRVCFEELEDWVREKIQGWVQELLEEEVTELLGRRKSERRRAVGSDFTHFRLLYEFEKITGEVSGRQPL